MLDGRIISDLVLVLVRPATKMRVWHYIEQDRLLKQCQLQQKPI
jgi:hypothetical protein